MIKITVKTLLASVGALTQLNQLSLPINSVRPIAKMARVIETELQDIDKARATIAATMPVQNTDEDKDAFNKRMNEWQTKTNAEWDEFTKTEVELAIDKFNVSLLGETKDFNADALMTLDWLIEF